MFSIKLQIVVIKYNCTLCSKKIKLLNLHLYIIITSYINSFTSPGPSSIENHAHRKASVKNSSKLNKFLQSEVNLLIQRIIVQDQDGPNNNIIITLNFRLMRILQIFFFFNSGRWIVVAVPNLDLKTILISYEEVQN